MRCEYCRGNILIQDDDGDIYCLSCTRYISLTPELAKGRKPREDKRKKGNFKL